METVIIGIHIPESQEQGLLIQETLTSFGCSIKTRLGLNHADDENAGSLILLELTGDKNEQKNLIDALKKIRGIEVKKMEFGK